VLGYDVVFNNFRMSELRLF